jgi:hypothetical protein
MARHSTSTEDRDTTDCFLDFQEIKDEPKNMQKPEIEHLVSGHDDQSESQYAMRSKVLIEGKKKPCPGAPLRYFRTLNAAVK